MIMKISATKDYSWDSLYEDKNIHDLHSILFEQHGGPDVDPEDQPDPGPDGHGGGGNDDDDDDDDGDGDPPDVPTDDEITDDWEQWCADNPALCQPPDDPDDDGEEKPTGLGRLMTKTHMDPDDPDQKRPGITTKWGNFWVSPTWGQGGITGWKYGWGGSVTW